jgi:hypothetical protein
VAEQKIIDLDKVLVGTFKIVLKGKEYTLPRSVPLKTAFGMMKLFEDVQGEGADAKANPEHIESLFDYIASLFKDNYSDMTTDRLKESMSFQQANILLREVVGEIFSQEEEAGNP